MPPDKVYSRVRQLLTECFGHDYLISVLDLDGYRRATDRTVKGCKCMLINCCRNTGYNERNLSEISTWKVRDIGQAARVSPSQMDKGGRESHSKRWAVT